MNKMLAFKNMPKFLINKVIKILEKKEILIEIIAIFS